MLDILAKLCGMDLTCILIVCLRLESGVDRHCVALDLPQITAL